MPFVRVGVPMQIALLPLLMTISPPDMVLEAGNSSTLARRNVPPSKSRTAFWSFRSLNLCVDSLGQGASSACEMGRIGPDWM